MSSPDPNLPPPTRSISLPFELLSQIFLDPCLSKLDLVNLCRTSRQLLHPARQGLYRHLVARVWYEDFDAIPSYRMREAGRIRCDKRTRSLLRTLRKSPEIGKLALSLEVQSPMSPLYDLADLQCGNHADGISKLLKLVPNVLSLKDSGSYGNWLVDDSFLATTPRMIELDIASHWSHTLIEEESSLVNLCKLRIDSFWHDPFPEYSISTAPTFTHLRILDVREWISGDPVVELPARLVPELQVLRTSYASLRSIDISTFPRLRTLHLCNDFHEDNFPLLENAHRISASPSLTSISFELLHPNLPLIHRSIGPIVNNPPPSLKHFDFPEDPPSPFLFHTRLENIEVRLPPAYTAGQQINKAIFESRGNKFNFRVVEVKGRIDVFGKLF